MLSSDCSCAEFVSITESEQRKKIVFDRSDRFWKICFCCCSRSLIVLMVTMPASGRRDDETNGIGDEEEEFEVADVRDRIQSSRGSRFNLLERELGIEPVKRIFSRETVLNGIKDLSKGLIIHPENKYVSLSLSLSLSLSQYHDVYFPSSPSYESLSLSNK
ncbi:hypothetical protein U1Q18_011380 [Sarracenia purpurea var. burkii]